MIALPKFLVDIKVILCWGNLSTTYCIIITSLLAITAYILLRRDPRIKYHLNKFSGPPYIPVFGSTLEYLYRPQHEYMVILTNWVEKYGGPCIPFWIGNFIPYLSIVDPVVAGKILSSTIHIDKGKYDYTLLDAWLGTGLLTAPGIKWGKRRKLLGPSFHFKILEDFVPVFNEQAEILVKCLEDEAIKNQYFNIAPYIAKCSLDVIFETIMGKKIETQTSSINMEYIDTVNEYLALIIEKLLRPWLRIPVIYYLSSMRKRERKCLNLLNGCTNKVIRERKLERERERMESENFSDERIRESDCKGKKRSAFLDLILDAAESNNLTDRDIQEEVSTFMFAGHDTTGVNLGWTILMLAMHPQCQAKVQLELDEIFANDPEREVTLVDLSKMKYLECCIKETLRLYPSVPMIMRQINNDIVLDDGRVIPKGVTAIVAIYFIHRNADYYSEPLAFKPERFLATDSDLKSKTDDHRSTEATSTSSWRKHSPYSYIPFSSGPRNCIGQKFALLEEKTILAKIFLSYRIEAEVKEMGKVKVVPDIVLRNNDGFRVKVFKR